MAPGQTPGPPPGRTPESDHSGRIPEEAIREQLNRVLASHEFRSSKRSRDFLKFVIDNTLGGHADILKERTIGIEVFGRSTSYDPSDDATVRVKAGEVRKRLGIYYSGQGAHDPIRIELPGGTYVPEFRWTESEGVADHVPAGVAEAHAAAEPVLELGPPREAAPQAARLWQLGIILLLACAGLAAALLWFRSQPANTTIDKFWSPVLQGTSPVSVCAAYVPDLYKLRDPNMTQPARLDDFVPIPDQFVGSGDLVAVSKMAAMLARLQRPYRVRVGGDVSFSDLRTSPAILIGYSYTRWKEISSQLRFFIDTSRRPIGITDNGARTKWTLSDLPAGRQISEDYAIVSRVFHPDTHAMLVEVAGIKDYGTEAAADLVTNAELLAEALRGAPAGWQSKNLQLVLHVKVISGAPSSPQLVASHFW